MRRLVLFSSFAFNPNIQDVVKKIIPQEISDKHMVFIPANGIHNAHTEILDYWETVAKNHQIGYTCVDNSPDQSPDDLKFAKQQIRNANIILISGGDTYPMLSNFQKSGLDQAILTYWQRENIVLSGFSAGALLLTPTINVNKVRLESYAKFSEEELKALHLVDFTIFPHYEEKRHKTMLAQYRSQYSTEIRPLPNDAHIVIEK
ncbi:Peptidase E [Candidatus Lokiarchaeum ossiferum]|uniref:Peptidase E n=1 Tax=Candidatus Lokiarchaeum ossiferum TaxID=2951803 RepID=A0ABY6HVX2_9ARCH|nr:Peptidase E [Candidatus Lokiarchaeum sp. B-35]